MEKQLAAALGPKPRSEALRRALDVGSEDDSFFVPFLESSESGESTPGNRKSGSGSHNKSNNDDDNVSVTYIGESVSQYSAALAAHELVSRERRVVLVPLGMSDSEKQKTLVSRALGFVRAFCHPLQASAHCVPQLDSVGKMRLYRAGAGGQVSCATKLVQVLERYAADPRCVVIGLALSLPTTPSLAVSASGGVAVVDVSQGSCVTEREALLRVARAGLQSWSRVQDCAFFRCALNAQRPSSSISSSPSPPFVLCPVCLRKLSVMPGPPALDCATRYAALFDFYTSLEYAGGAFATERQWVAERLAWLGRFQFVEQISLEAESQGQRGSSEESEDDGRVQARQLSTLKARMRAKPRRGHARSPFGRSGSI